MKKDKWHAFLLLCWIWEENVRVEGEYLLEKGKEPSERGKDVTRKRAQ